MKNFYLALSLGILICFNNAFGSEAGMPQLDPKFWGAQIFWLILIFSTLLIIIWKIFLPKITHSIENRKSRIVNDLNEAQKLKESAEKKLTEYQKIIDDSKKDAKKIIFDSKKKLEQDIEDKRKKFESEIESELNEAEKKIQNLKKDSISSIKKIAEETSAEIVRHIIGTEVNRSNVSAVLNDVLKEKIEKKI